MQHTGAPDPAAELTRRGGRTEVYVDLECTVMEFMERQQKEEGTDAKAILDGLVAIGFTDERMQVPPSRRVHHHSKFFLFRGSEGDAPCTHPSRH